jgi:hypothetical protein
MVEKTLTNIKGGWRDFSKIKGSDIKGRANALIFSEDAEVKDSFLSETVIRLLKKKPFLSAAVEVTTNWDDFVDYPKTT